MPAILATIGWGEILLALVPTFNLLVLALVWKITGKTQTELAGQTTQLRSDIADTQEAIQTDLRNGIRNKVNEAVDRIGHVETQVAELHDKVDNLE